MKINLLRLSYFFFASAFFNNHLFAQSKFILRGNVLGIKDSVPLKNCAITLKNNNFPSQYSFTDSNGFFKLVCEDTNAVSIDVSLISHAKFTEKIYFKPHQPVIDLKIFLQKTMTVLEEITIKNIATGYRIDGDTTTYDANKFYQPSTRKVEDLLKNIDGFKVNGSGKIFYKGKAVKAVMLNDEDLADNQYELITQNLSAAFIDSIKVLENYNANKILGSVNKSGEVALNLILKKNIPGKLSGTLSLALSMKERNETDINLIYIKPKLKLLFLANGNRTGKISSNIDPNSFAKENFDEAFLSNGAVKSSQIGKPDMAETYTIDNNDLYASTIIQGKLSKSTSIKTRLSFYHSQQNQFEQNQTAINIANEFEWSLQTSRNKIGRSKSQFLTSKLENGNLRRTHSFECSFIRQNINDDFNDISTGSLMDDYVEIFKANNSSLSAAYQFVLKTGLKSAFTVTSKLVGDKNRIKPEYKTGRFGGFFNTTANLYSAVVSVESMIQKTEVAYYHMSNGWSKKYAIMQQMTTLQADNDILVPISINTPLLKKSIFENTKSTNQRIFSWLAHCLLTKKIDKSYNISLNVNAGLGNQRAIDTSIFSLIYKTKLSISFGKKTFPGLSFSAEMARMFPTVRHFLFDSLINGDYSLSRISNILNPENFTEFTGSYAWAKGANRKSIFVNTSYKIEGLTYLPAFTLSPGVTQMKYIPVKNNRSFSILAGGTRFSYLLSSVLSLSFQFLSNSFFQPINQLLVKTKMNSINASASIASNFKFPLNYSLVYTLNRQLTKQLNNSELIKNSFTSHQFNLKCRLQFSKKYYFGVDLNNFVWPKSTFIAMDIYSTYQINKKIQFDIRIHNLLDKKNYTELVLTPTEESTRRYQTVGRYAFVRCNYSF
jgi:hypothetical protein